MGWRWGLIAGLVSLMAAPALSAGSGSPSAQAEAAILAQISGGAPARLTSVPVFIRLAAPRPAMPVEDRRALVPLAEAAAMQHGLDTEFFKRLIRQESGYNPSAVSSAGAQGIAQFMPGTAALVGLDDPFDPRKALPKSAQYLALLRQQFGNLGLAAAAYNAGEARVRAWLAGRGGLPAETRAYVLAITGRDALDWVPPGATPGPVQLARAEGLRGGIVPSFARLQSAEWTLGTKLMGASQAQLATLLDTQTRPPGRVATKLGARAATPSPRPDTGERSLCASMGCIVAAAY